MRALNQDVRSMAADDGKLRILVLYNIGHTFTNAVHEHLLALKTYSESMVSYAAIDSLSTLSSQLSEFDAIIVHFSVRLPFDQIGERAAEKLGSFPGVKALMIQDDYDNPLRACYWMKRCCFDLVFTVVPHDNIEKVYKTCLVPRAEFVSVLTGYTQKLRDERAMLPPSARPITIGYRGRVLPLQYGQLGREKVSVGVAVRDYCATNGIVSDIAWTDDKRLYGDLWYDFIASCRASLGSESGCNVFDWSNDLSERLAAFRAANPAATEDEAYEALIAPLEVPGLMNQISPRCFEAIALKSVLVLYEGTYSGILQRDTHYISLNKDFSNLGSVFDRLNDGVFCDAMAERAYADIISSDAYSYGAFVRLVNAKIAEHWRARPRGVSTSVWNDRAGGGLVITDFPQRVTQPVDWPISLWDALSDGSGSTRLRRGGYYLWGKVPAGWRKQLRPRMRKVFGFD